MEYIHIHNLSWMVIKTLFIEKKSLKIIEVLNIFWRIFYYVSGSALLDGNLELSDKDEQKKFNISRPI